MIWRQKRGDAEAAAQGSADLTEVLAEAVEGIRPGDADAIDHVVDVLLRLDRLDDHTAARRALRPFAARPRVVVWLDERVRRILWLTDPAAAAIGRAVEQLPYPTARATATCSAESSRRGLTGRRLHRTGLTHDLLDHRPSIGVADAEIFGVHGDQPRVGRIGTQPKAGHLLVAQRVLQLRQAHVQARRDLAQGRRGGSADLR